MSSPQKTAVIIGAGPAGLTASYELLLRTGVHPIVLESDPEYVGGISRTVHYKGNRIDIGGHRFFSKSDKVMQWWARLLPIKVKDGEQSITYQRSVRALTEGLRRADESHGERVMEVRPRKTRIINGGKLFAYPVELSLDTLLKLGPIKVVRIGVTYVYAMLFPRTPEVTLEDFFLNRFGKELYETFFKSYTEKVWGTKCNEMSAEWGAQRVKGLSITKAIMHALRKIFRIGALSGKGVETSLIEQFLYPTYGPGFLWEQAAAQIVERGGEIRMGTRVVRIDRQGERFAVVAEGPQGRVTLEADYVFSTTDIKGLIRMLPEVPERVLKVSDGLQYRDFLTVGLLLKERPLEPDGSPLTDTWMYIHEEGLRAGRIQIFHNWHDKLVADPANGWIGLEYFCQEGDDLWSMSDEELVALGTRELEALGLAKPGDVVGGTALRQPKAYPGYFGTYGQFDVVRSYLDTLPNLFPIGRNGMHRYNNQDHSMLAAMGAVDIVERGGNKAELWNINAEQEYHEQK